MPGGEPIPTLQIPNLTHPYSAAKPAQGLSIALTKKKIKKNQILRSENEANIAYKSMCLQYSA